MEYRLEELFDLQMGKTPSRSNAAYWGTDDHKWISIADLSKCEKYICETKERISDEAVSESGISLIPANTVVMSFKLSIGKTAITKEEMYSNEAIMAFHDRHVIDMLPEYIFYMLNAHDWNEGTNKAVMGKTLNKATLSKIKVHVHSYEEQAGIVAILDKTMEIVAARRRQIQMLDELVSARFVEMFGDPYVNPYGWPRIKIGEAVTVEPQNGMYKPQSDYVTDGSGTPILRIDGFYEGEVTDFATLKRLKCTDEERQKYLLCEDDVVINRVNSIEYLGKCAHITGLLEDTVYESNMMRMHFDPARFNPVYVCRLLCTDFIYDQIVNHAKKAVNQASINQKDVLDFEIYEPSAELQEQFSYFVAQVDKSKVAVQKGLDEAQLLFDSLMQQYFG